eukprot:scaffold171559_cov34-Tisochrysis_lutea.AAC.3
MPATAGTLSSTARPSAQALAELLRGVEPSSSVAQGLLTLPEFEELVSCPAYLLHARCSTKSDGL